MQTIGQKWESGDYVGAVLDGIQAGVGAKRMLQACFAAGTKLRTPGGWKAIEEFAVGDVLLSRDEWDAGGAVEAKAVEEVFVRTGRVAGLHVGGRVIRTTLEHPFWCVGRGWVACGELRPGDVLVGSDGTPVAVEEVFDENQYETVYNLRIADHHTYFVGEESWGFDAWVHNARYADFSKISNQGIQNVKSKPMNLMKSELHHVATNKGKSRDNQSRHVFSHMFAGARMSNNDRMNLVRIQGHAGPHGLHNHAVFQRLRAATRDTEWGSREYRRAFRYELNKVRNELKKGDGIGAMVRVRIQQDGPEMIRDRQLSIRAAQELELPIG